RLPSDADVARMDVAGAERALRPVLRTDSASVTYLVNGKPVTAEVARAVLPEVIGSVEVMKSKGHDYISLKLRDANGGERHVLGDTIHLATGKRADGRPDTAMAILVQKVAPATFGSFTGLLLIDGVRSDQAALNTLDRNTIVS